MKKVVSNTGEVISFLVRGQRHSRNAVEYHIDADGVIVKDSEAAFIEARLGTQVTISDIDVKEAKKQVDKAIKAAGKTDKKSAKTDEKDAVTEEDAATEDEPKVTE